ncbi:hypothetical protein GALMADRAFT_1364491 [Galerina marginata CBS 339.88]|uniref:Uncharacterized protein n=1 Tax=Galerina marginata (strain CBS 339.88) TaxID=685588 RepID=A0A067SFT0_GALM3|nr:hypothetical protein GALMADRAFT_1364491 [Galerina marginata CBS 339.88]
MSTTTYATTAHAFEPSSTSKPGLGYIIVSQPQTAKFRALGQYFCVSDLPGGSAWDLVENSLGPQICVWLGPDLVETAVYLIWPGWGVYSLGPPLNASNPSRVINLEPKGNEALINCEPPNNIALELLHINKTPCFLFIRQKEDDYAMVQEEAESLSFIRYALLAINNFLSSLEKQKQSPGDAVQASALESWYNSMLAALSEEGEEKFLFDPTLLLAGLIKHLGARIKEINGFDIAAEALLLIPMVFIRNWKEYMTGILAKSGKEVVVKSLLQSSEF